MDGDADAGEGVEVIAPWLGTTGSGFAERRPAARDFEPVGDAVCWLEQVCDDCGALVEDALPASCWRCGADVAPA